MPRKVREELARQQYVLQRMAVAKIIGSYDTSAEEIPHRADILPQDAEPRVRAHMEGRDGADEGDPAGNGDAGGAVGETESSKARQRSLKAESSWRRARHMTQAVNGLKQEFSDAALPPPQLSGSGQRRRHFAEAVSDKLRRHTAHKVQKAYATAMLEDPVDLDDTDDETPAPGGAAAHSV